MKSRLGLTSNARFIDNLQKVFKENSKEFAAKDVSEYKWNDFSLNLLDAWNLKEESSLADADEDELPAASQDYILTQYI